MVSKIDILQRFYQIYIKEEKEFFIYQGNNYYICKINNFSNQYSYYIRLLNLKGFKLINNCFNKPTSMGYTLYYYNEEKYSINDFINISLQPQKETILISNIKKSWITILDTIRKNITSYTTKINNYEYYILLSHYYLGLGENAISILNIIEQSKITLGIEHLNFKNNYKCLLAPNNIIIASRIKDLTTAFKKEIITPRQFNYYINTYKLNKEELIYMYARLLFSNEFFELVLKSNNINKEELLDIYHCLDQEREIIKVGYQIINQYVNIPNITWLNEK